MAALNPIDFGVGVTVKQLACGGYHVCAVLSGDVMKCWGAGFWGQLGRDSLGYVGRGADEVKNLSPIFLGAGRHAVSIDLGAYHTCAILDDGSVRCWGLGDHGALGQDSTTNWGSSPTFPMSALPPIALGARTAVQVSCGWDFTLILLDNGDLISFGRGEHGSTGRDSTADIGGNVGDMAIVLSNPVNLLGERVRDVSAGKDHSCATFEGTGAVKCFGRGWQGRLVRFCGKVF